MTNSSSNTIIILFGIILLVIAIVSYLTSSAHASKENQQLRRLYRDTDQTFTPRTPAKWPIALGAAALVIVILGNCFTVVPTGYTGVRTTFGLIDQESCTFGFNPVIPFVQKISLVNNKQQDLHIETPIEGETSEEVSLTMSGITVTYQVNPEASAWIYANVENWIEKLIDPEMVGSSVKSAARSLEASVVTDRAKIEPLSVDMLQQSVDKKYGENRISIRNIIINNITFEPAYEQAISNKSAAMQDQQEQEIRNKTAVDYAKAQADALRETARGEADAELIRAEGKAKAAKEIANNVTTATQVQDAIDKWDGTLPKATGENASFGILELAESVKPSGNSTGTTVTPTPTTGG